MSYYRDTYLKSDHWQNLRLERLAIDKRCIVCGHETPSNDVHHIRYATSLWEVKASDLRVLCRTCHDEIHRIMKCEAHVNCLPKHRQWGAAYDHVMEDRVFAKAQKLTEKQKAAQLFIDGLWAPIFSWCKTVSKPWAVIFLLYHVSNKHDRDTIGYAKLGEHNRRQTRVSRANKAALRKQGAPL